MLSNNRIALGVTMLLAGCASGGGYGDAPRIADPSARGMEEPYQQARPDYPEPAARAPAGDLQREYEPEPGAPSYDAAQDAPRPTSPGAGYARPGARPARTAPTDPYREAPAPAPVYRDVPSKTPSRAFPADAPPALTSGTGPRGTSGEAQRYDAVGYASWYGEEMGDAPTASGQPFAPDAITAAHRTLPLGSIAEVTALDTGRTILVLVNDRGPGAPGREIDLSRGAAQALGLNSAMSPVRVRLVTASASDTVALRQGRAAGPRIDAPPSLLAALRRKLPARTAPVPAAPRPVRQQPVRQQPGTAYAPPAVRQPAAPRGRAGLFVQVAALSSAARAQALADSLGGRIERAGSVYRVQIGPFANTATAQRARDDVARRGYGDARIVQTN